MEALGRLARDNVPERVLAVCQGNICRSPYVEAYLEEKGSDLGMRLASAGFIGPGRPPPPEALAAAARRGIDTSGHVSRLVSDSALGTSDFVILVDPKHRKRFLEEVPSFQGEFLVLGDLDPEVGSSRTIQDPWGRPPDVFEEVFARMDRCLNVLLDSWRRCNGS